MADAALAEVIDRLDALAETPSSERDRAAAEALRAASHQEREVRAAAARAVGATVEPPAAIATLSKLADDPDVGVRYETAAVLAASPWRGRLDVLARLLDDEDLGVVGVAADGLAYSGDSRAVEALYSLLSEKRLRFAALEGLLILREERLRTELAPDLFKRIFAPPFERALAAVALAAEGNESARQYLRLRMAKKRAEERPFILLHLSRVDPGEGRAMIERIARDEQDYLRESAILALLRLDSSWWPEAQQAIIGNADDDTFAAAEVLRTLLEIDSEHADLFAAPHVHRQDELGASARRVRLAASLRRDFPREVLPRCD